MNTNESFLLSEKETKDMLFPIRELSLKTGVNSVTLRAWERRYGLLKPIRTEKGHRLYSDQDVQKVTAIVNWINKGVAVSKVRALLDQKVDINDGSVSSEWFAQQESLLLAIEQFQEDKIDALIQQNFSQYPMETVIHYWLSPVFSRLQQNTSTSALASYFIALLKQRINSRLLSRDKAKQQEKVLLTCLDGEPSIWTWLQAAWCSDEGLHVIVIDTLSSLEDNLPLIEGIKPNYFVSHLDCGFGDKQYLKVELKNLAIPVVLSGATMWLEENQNQEKSGLDIFSNSFDAILCLIKQLPK
ncbi:MerR family transcriptional regulator [Marinomonas sp. 2405UD68-3]|uniref:MerR family transcriptional regulator n=1 Tax=Marinomonas sp. 2405UD68-3 TaxID=3391835 RepID=UPI0039C903CF